MQKNIQWMTKEDFYVLSRRVDYLILLTLRHHQRILEFSQRLHHHDEEISQIKLAINLT